MQKKWKHLIPWSQNSVARTYIATRQQTTICWPEDTVSLSRQLLPVPSSAKHNLKIQTKTDPFTNETDATVFVWFVCHISGRLGFRHGFGFGTVCAQVQCTGKCVCQGQLSGSVCILFILEHVNTYKSSICHICQT